MRIASNLVVVALCCFAAMAVVHSCESEEKRAKEEAAAMPIPHPVHRHMINLKKGGDKSELEKAKKVASAALVAELPEANVNTAEIVRQAKMAAAKAKASPSNFKQWEEEMKKKMAAQQVKLAALKAKAQQAKKTVKVQEIPAAPAKTEAHPKTFEEWEKNMQQKWSGETEETAFMRIPHPMHRHVKKGEILKSKDKVKVVSGAELPGANVNTAEIIRKAKEATTKAKASPSNFQQWEQTMKKKMAAQQVQLAAQKANPQPAKKMVKVQNVHVAPARPEVHSRSFEKWEKKVKQKFSDLQEKKMRGVAQDKEGRKVMPVPRKPYTPSSQQSVQQQVAAAAANNRKMQQAAKMAPFPHHINLKQEIEAESKMAAPNTARKAPISREQWEAMVRSNLAVADNLNPILPDYEERREKLRKAANQEYPWA